MTNLILCDSNSGKGPLLCLRSHHSVRRYCRGCRRAPSRGKLGLKPNKVERSSDYHSRDAGSNDGQCSSTCAIGPPPGLSKEDMSLTLNSRSLPWLLSWNASAAMLFLEQYADKVVFESVSRNVNQLPWTDGAMWHNSRLWQHTRLSSQPPYCETSEWKIYSVGNVISCPFPGQCIKASVSYN